MPQFYVVKGIGGGFDGLVVEAEPAWYEGVGGVPDIFLVRRLIDPNRNIGDRTVALPLPDGSVYIGKPFLETTDDPGTREFASDNPFGRHLASGEMEMGDIRISYSLHERALSATVYDLAAKRTVFSQNFTKDPEKVKQAIHDLLKENGGSDLDDLVFRLRELKEAEDNGQA